MSSELTWHDAIVKVLEHAASAMHYADIADAITSGGLESTLGATPAATVNSVINVSIDREGSRSPFIRVKRGEYTLRALHLGANASLMTMPESAAELVPDEEDVAEPSAIKALGMFWRRELVNWTSMPSLLGQQQRNSKTVDFSSQHGIYLLHDGRETVYVGRVTDRPLGRRLTEHTTDRLNGRWDRFSWYGIHEVTESGEIRPQTNLGLGASQIIVELEAVLIEALEPPLNRRRGDGLRAVEYIQVEDPAIREQHVLSMMSELQANLLRKTTR